MSKANLKKNAIEKDITSAGISVTIFNSYLTSQLRAKYRSWLLF